MIDFSLLFPDELKEPYTWLSGVGTWEEYRESRTGPECMHLGIKDNGALVAVASCELYGDQNQNCGFHVCKKKDAISGAELRRVWIEIARIVFGSGVSTITASFPNNHWGAQKLVEDCDMQYMGDVQGDSFYQMTLDRFEKIHGRKSQATISEHND